MKRWSPRELEALANHILAKSSYSLMIASLGRSEAAIKAMIEGRSGAGSYKLLQEKLAAGLKAQPAVAKHLASLRYVEPDDALGSGKRLIPPLVTPPLITPLIDPHSAPKSKKPAKHRVRWEDNDILRLKKMFSLNFDPERIAQRLERTVPSVLSKLCSVGLLKYDRDFDQYYTYKLYYPAE